MKIHNPFPDLTKWLIAVLIAVVLLMIFGNCKKAVARI
jgi:hypothetical protein